MSILVVVGPVVLNLKRYDLYRSYSASYKDKQTPTTIYTYKAALAAILDRWKPSTRHKAVHQLMTPLTKTGYLQVHIDTRPGRGGQGGKQRQANSSSVMSYQNQHKEHMKPRDCLMRE